MFLDVLDNSSETNRLLRGSDQGQLQAWDALLQRHHDRLRRMVSLRIDHRLRGWIDPSEVVRLAWIEACNRRGEYLDRPPGSFFLWMRGLAGAQLQEIQQQRLGEELPRTDRPLSLHRDSLPPATSFALAAQLLGQQGSPSQAALRSRRLLQLEDALNSMDAVEREVLALRHFEQLDNAETAALLQIDEGSASRTYLRALKRLREILNSLPSEGTRS